MNWRIKEAFYDCCEIAIGGFAVVVGIGSGFLALFKLAQMLGVFS